MAVVLAGWAAVGIHEAFAPPPWNANLNANLLAGKKSKGIRLTWETDYPIACNPERLRLAYEKLNPGPATPPSYSDPTAGTFLAFLDVGDSDYKHIPLHAAILGNG